MAIQTRQRAHMMRVWKLRYGEPLDVQRVWIVSPVVGEAIFLWSELLVESLLADARESSEAAGKASARHGKGIMSVSINCGGCLATASGVSANRQLFWLL